MYGFSRVLDAPFEETLARIKEALKEEGFGILSEIDVKDIMRDKLDVDFRKYTILGACNPQLAHRAFSAELEIGLLLPCNVIIYECDEGGTSVSAVNTEALLSVVSNEELKGIAEEANKKLKCAIQAL